MRVEARRTRTRARTAGRLEPVPKLPLLALLVASAAFAQSEFTLYDLLPPETHKFAITYDVAYAAEGAQFFVNPIRKGSKVSDERVIDLATGKPLKFEGNDQTLK